ncbi:MAG: azurin [Zetaproteobacteria bacterium]|nr:azurin [Pseudobdellovibrionaceae bacterium]
MIFKKFIFGITIYFLASCTCENNSKAMKNTEGQGKQDKSTEKKSEIASSKKGEKSATKEMEDIEKVKALHLAASQSCKIIVDSSDQMKYSQNGKDLKTLKVPSACKKFYIHLKHVGQLPSAAMGHNIVISKETDVDDLISKSLRAGKKGHYLPGDPRSLAQSHILLGGSAGDVKEDFIEVDMSKFMKNEKYKFYCTFPGHYAMMQGEFIIE